MTPRWLGGRRGHCGTVLEFGTIKGAHRGAKSVA